MWLMVVRRALFLVLKGLWQFPARRNFAFPIWLHQKTLIWFSENCFAGRAHGYSVVLHTCLPHPLHYALWCCGTKYVNSNSHVSAILKWYLIQCKDLFMWFCYSLASVLSNSHCWALFCSRVLCISCCCCLGKSFSYCEEKFDVYCCKLASANGNYFNQFRR